METDHNAVADRYEVLGKLPRLQLLARDRRCEREVMILVRPLSPNRSADWTRDAQRLASLEHPHLQTILDFGDDDGWYAVFPHSHTPTLHDHLKKGPLHVSRVLNLVRQVCSGLAHAHATGLLHRAITPDAVRMLSLPDGRDLARLESFDLADCLALDDLAPELKHGGSATVQTDIYGLGIVLHAGMVGRNPSVKPDSPMLPGIRWLIERATHADPAERFANVHEFERGLQFAQLQLSGDVDREAVPALENGVLVWPENVFDPTLGVTAPPAMMSTVDPPPILRVTPTPPPAPVHPSKPTLQSSWLSAARARLFGLTAAAVGLVGIGAYVTFS